MQVNIFKNIIPNELLLHVFSSTNYCLFLYFKVDLSGSWPADDNKFYDALETEVVLIDLKSVSAVIRKPFVSNHKPKNVSVPSMQIKVML